jgi:ABC-type Fe3+ transport system permease subunit
VIVPISIPSLAAVTLYVFIVSWNDFVYARTFLAGGPASTITVGSTTFVGDYILEWNTAMAACVIAILPIMLVFLVLQRHFVRGVTAGHHQLGFEDARWRRLTSRQFVSASEPWRFFVVSTVRSPTVSLSV